MTKRRNVRSATFDRRPAVPEPPPFGARCSGGRGRGRIDLVACAKRKGPEPAPARGLYPSALFRKAAACCAGHYDRWYVLSAKHGLVAPETVLAPYDVTLADLSAEARERWGERIAADLEARHPGPQAWYLHAGVPYRRHLLAPPGRLKGSVAVPLEGLKIGEQLAWYVARSD